MKPGIPVLRSIRLLDQVRECARYLHYSFSTERAYLYRVRLLSAGMAALGLCGIRERWGA